MLYYSVVCDDMKARSSSVREERAEVTKDAIRRAARRLFVERGFASTSIQDLAAEAGVAVRTIYLAFGSKQGVAVDLIVRIGVDADAETVMRELAPDATDPARLLAAMSRYRRNLFERGADVITMVREGVGSSPELRVALDLGIETARAAFQGLCARLDEIGVLKTGLDVDEAAGHALVLSSVDGYDELVNRRGWSHDDYEAWLCRALVEALTDG
jgi:TetR/AcrR family transcriptional regulator, regulator of cefoperazone and chloramphenicol sensitivity